MTLPSDFVRVRKVRAGQEVFVEADVQLDLVQFRTAHGSTSSLTPEFKLWLDEVTTKYRDTIKELAQK